MSQLDVQQGTTVRVHADIGNALDVLEVRSLFASVAMIIAHANLALADWVVDQSPWTEARSYRALRDDHRSLDYQLHKDSTVQVERARRQVVRVAERLSRESVSQTPGFARRLAELERSLAVGVDVSAARRHAEGLAEELNSLVGDETSTDIIAVSTNLLSQVALYLTEQRPDGSFDEPKIREILGRARRLDIDGLPRIGSPPTADDLEALVRAIEGARAVGSGLFTVDELGELYTPPTRVLRWVYRNPIDIDLFQSVPASVELAASTAVFTRCLRVLLGSGPRERAEAAEIRSRLRANRFGQVVPDDIVRAADAVAPYDWQIEVD